MIIALILQIILPIITSGITLGWIFTNPTRLIFLDLDIWIMYLIYAIYSLVLGFFVGAIICLIISKIRSKK